MALLGERGLLRSVAGGQVAFWCPGCDEAHVIRVDGAHAWGWNRDPDKPTFSPSILVRGTERLSDEEYQLVMSGRGKVTPRPTVCHSFVTDGRIGFLGDCTHALKSRTVDLPPFYGGDL